MAFSKVFEDVEGIENIDDSFSIVLGDKLLDNVDSERELVVFWGGADDYEATVIGTAISSELHHPDVDPVAVFLGGLSGATLSG